MNTMPTSLVITLLMLSKDGTTWQGLLSGSSHSCSSATFVSTIEAKHLFENIWRTSDFQGVYKPCFLEKTIEVEGSTDVETGAGKSKIRVFWPSLNRSIFQVFQLLCKTVGRQICSTSPFCCQLKTDECDAEWKVKVSRGPKWIQSQTFLWTDRRQSFKCVHFAHYQYEHAIPHNNAMWYLAIPQCTIALDGSFFSGLGLNMVQPKWHTVQKLL